MHTVLLHEEFEVPRPAADCYRYLRDFSTTEQWDPSVLRAQKVTPGEPAVGTEFRVTLRSFGRQFDMDYRLIEARQDHWLRLQGVGGGVRADDRIGFIAQGPQRTRIVYEAELQLSALARLGGPLLESLMRRMGRESVAGLRRALAPDARPPQQSGRATVAQRLLLPEALNFTAEGYRRMSDKAHSRYLDAQTIVVTGPTSGIGLAAACELARLGARLVLIGRGQDRLERAAEQIHDFAGAACALRLVEADLADPVQLQHAVEIVFAKEPRIDALINNAGALFDSRQSAPDGHERTLAINLLAPYRLTSALLPLLTRHHGRVINVSSGGQYLQALDVDDLDYRREPFDGVKAYAQTKRALISLTRSWAQQYPEIGFHAMHPGWAATPGVAKSLPGFNRVMQRYLRDARMGADTLVWLCAQDAAALGSGSFWLDRRVVTYDVVPGTRVSPAQARKLMARLAEMR